MNTSKFPAHIYEYLRGRGITDETLEKFNISYNATTKKIVIPVYDQQGNHLFNKYRKDPADQDSSTPKYTYDYGAKAALFGVDKIFAGERQIFIAEGELDVLILHSYGLRAVSSTGGCGTFESEWEVFFTNKDTYIVYDHDDAGYKGALRVQTYLPHAKIMRLPNSVGEHGDVTDFFSIGDNDVAKFLELANEATSFDFSETDDLQVINERIKEAESRAKDLEDWFLDARVFRFYAEDMRKLYDSLTKPRRVAASGDLDMDRIERAKTVPIDSIINFTRGKATSIWKPNERTPSMHYYPKSNRVKCYATGNHGDVIDVVMITKEKNFNEAIAYLLNE